MTVGSSSDRQIDLESYSLNALRAMLRARGDASHDSRLRGEVIGELRRRLFDARSIRQAIEDCDRFSLEGLWLMRERGGVVSVAALRGQLATWHPGRPPDETQGVPNSLVRRALGFWRSSQPRYRSGAYHDTSGAATDFPHSTEIFSVPDILDLLPPGVAPPVVTPRPVDPPTEYEPGGGAGRLVLAMLRAIEERGPRILRSGAMSSRDRRAIAAALGYDTPGERADSSEAPRDPPPDHGMLVDFYRGVLQSAGLVRLTDDWRLQATEASGGFVMLPPHQQTRTLLEAWLRDGENVMAALSHLEWHSRASPSVSSVTDDRVRDAYARIVDVMRDRILPGNWFDVAELSRVLRHLDVEFLVRWLGPASPAWHGSIDLGGLSPPVYSGITLQDSRGRSRWLVMGNDWDLVEGALIRAVVRGPLCWLGVVDVRSLADGKEIFTLTRSGARALGVDVSDEQLDLREAESNAGALVVQPNFDVLVYDPHERPELLYLIDRFAERIAVDRLAVYRLTRDALCAGLQVGVTIGDVVTLLERASRSSIPRNVEVSLRDWARQFESVRWLRNGYLLEAPDETTLDRWLASPRLQAVVDRRLAPTFALLRASDVGHLRDLIPTNPSALRVVDGNDPMRAHAYVRESADLVVDPGDLNLFLDFGLARFADRSADATGPTYFRVSRESIAGAIAAGLTAERILADLELLLGGHVPPGLRVRIKGWSGGYEAVRVGQIAVISTGDATTLREIRADPELGRLILAQITSIAGLVRVDDLDRLRDGLAARGIAVEVDDLAHLPDAIPSNGAPPGSTTLGHYATQARTRFDLTSRSRPERNPATKR